MEFLTQELTFERKSRLTTKEFNEIGHEQIIKHYQAITEEYIFNAKVVDDVVTFSILSKTESEKQDDVLYAFKYDTKTQKEANYYTETFPNQLRLDTYERSIINKNILSHYHAMLKREKEREKAELEARKRMNEQPLHEKRVLTNPSHHPHPKIPTRTSASTPAFREKVSSVDITKQNLVNLRSSEVVSERISKLKKPLIDLPHLKMITSIVDMKEDVLTSIHLLKHQERENFVHYWMQFDILMEKNKNLMTTYTSKEQSYILRSIHRLYDRIRKMHEDVIIMRGKPKENIEISMLSAEVVKLHNQITNSGLLNDIVFEHHYSTIREDYLKLMGLYHQVKTENRNRLEADIIAGLQEVAFKLKPFESKLWRNEERSVERQVEVLKERYIESKA